MFRGVSSVRCTSDRVRRCGAGDLQVVACVDRPEAIPLWICEHDEVGVSRISESHRRRATPRPTRHSISRTCVPAWSTDEVEMDSRLLLGRCIRPRQRRSRSLTRGWNQDRESVSSSARRGQLSADRTTRSSLVSRAGSGADLRLKTMEEKSAPTDLPMPRDASLINGLRPRTKPVVDSYREMGLRRVIRSELGWPFVRCDESSPGGSWVPSASASCSRTNWASLRDVSGSSRVRRRIPFVLAHTGGPDSASR